MKPLGVPLMMLTLSLCVAAHSETEGETLFAERGYRGIVPCNPAASLEYTFDDLEGVFWYFGQYDQYHFIFSYFHGALYQGDGIPERTYNISSNFGLIIQNVTDSDEGRYYYKVEPKLGRIYRGSKKVEVKVTSKQLFPTVPGCDPRPSKPEDTCIVSVPHDVVTISLTCKVEHVKPAVDIQWFHVLPDGGAEQVNSSIMILPVSRPGSSFDNTYTSLLTLHQPTKGDDIMKYRCEAHGVAVGSENGSHLLVSVRKISPKVHADWVVYLERGQHGIVSFLQNTSFAYTTEDLDCVFWYFGSRDREHAIGSYSHDTISPQNGICLGCNNISSNLALVIQNVTDSHEGTYFYTVVPHVGRLHEGTVEVAVKVSAKKPFPVVPGCVPQQSELSDECIISVPHDMVNVTLTCKVEQVKPPVAIRWSIVFQDGRVEEAESTYTRHLKEAHRPGSFDNTYTTVSSLYLSTTGDDSMRYRCEAHGVAVDRETRSQITVIVRRDSGLVQAETTRTTNPRLQNNPYIATTVVFIILFLISSVIQLTSRFHKWRLKRKPQESRSRRK